MPARAEALTVLMTTGLTAHRNRAFIGLMDAAEDFHQRGLARHRFRR